MLPSVFDLSLATEAPFGSEIFASGRRESKLSKTPILLKKKDQSNVKNSQKYDCYLKMTSKNFSECDYCKV